MSGPYKKCGGCNTPGEICSRCPLDEPEVESVVEEKNVPLERLEESHE